MTHRLAGVALTLAVMASGAGAQERVGPIVLQLPGSTRALALGGAYPVGGADADAIFYNPVLLQTGRGVSLSVQRYGEEGTLTTLSTANDLNFGFGVQVLNYTATRSESGDDMGSPIALSRRGFIPTGEVVGTVGYMRTLPFNVRLGASVKWMQRWGDGGRTGAAAFDVGSAMNPLPWLNVALSVQNLGSTFDHFDGSEYELPARAMLLVSTRSRVVGPLDVALASRVNVDWEGDANGGIGVEAGYWPFSGLTFVARGGARFGTRAYRYVENLPPMPTLPTVIEESAFTAGGGVTYGRLTLDYAWEPFEGAADAHRIGLRIR